MKIIKNFIFIFGFILSSLVKKNSKIVIFFGNGNPNDYSSNQRHLFEYLNYNQRDLIPIWFCSNLNLYNFLKKKKLKCIYKYSIISVVTLLRARFVVGSDYKIPNYYGLLTFGNIKINVWHGFGPRTTNITPDIFKDGKQRQLKKKYFINKINQWDYFIFTSKFTAEIIGRKKFYLPKKKIKNFGMPRCDFLLKEDYFKKLNFKKKVILYAPTWRSDYNYNKDLILNLFSKNYFLDRFLRENKIIILISIHPMNYEILKKIKHIPKNVKILSQRCDFDINSIFRKVSILITDYSSIATDFLLTKKPILYYLPDYNAYLKKRWLLENFRKNLPGEEFRNSDELIFLIKKYIFQNSFLTKKNKKREIYLKKYFDINNTNSCEKIYSLIKEVNNI
jgi:CDP-glycerol glycerophosphotransferase